MPAYSQPGGSVIHAALRLLALPQIYGPAIAAVVAVAGRWLRKLWTRWKQAARERKVRNWPTITAAIEVPTVVEEYAAHKPYYVGSLTYFYRNPELQMGEYQRVFSAKREARRWVSQFKNRTVLVHVDPSNPAESVLFESEIAGADLPEMPEPRTRAQSGTLVAGEAVHALTPTLRLLCGVAELVGLAGFAASAVLLAASFIGAGRLPLHAYYWVCGSMLAVSLGCTVALYIDLARSESGRQLLRTYRRWCPGWMRWSLRFTGLFFSLGYPLLDFTRSLWGPHMHFFAKRFAPHLPYLLGCWVFFVLTAFLAAILSSQEDPRLSIEAVEA